MYIMSGFFEETPLLVFFLLAKSLVVYIYILFFFLLVDSTTCNIRDSPIHDSVKVAMHDLVIGRLFLLSNVRYAKSSE